MVSIDKKDCIKYGGVVMKEIISSAGIMYFYLRGTLDENMISFVETFADTYDVGIEFILKEGDKISKALKENNILKLFKNPNVV